MEWLVDSSSSSVKAKVLKWVLVLLPWVLCGLLAFFLFSKPDTTANDAKRSVNKEIRTEQLKVVVSDTMALLKMKDDIVLLNKQFVQMKNKIKQFEYYEKRSKDVFDEKVIDFRNADDSVRIYESARAVFEFRFD